MNCKKCGSLMTVILRKKDYYCDDCFLVAINHKFRACIGKNKVLSPNERILISLSGGLGSSVLLDLVHHGLSLDNTKKLRIVPYFLHLVDCKNVAEYVLKQCERYDFDVYMVPLSDYMNKDPIQLPKVNCVPHMNESETHYQFHDMLNSMLPTAVNDFLLKVKSHLFINIAMQLQCNLIFTAETTNTLATNLLCNLAIGRGSQVQNDVGFSDNRHEKVKIIRPMKDISKEELEYYVKIKKLTALGNNNVRNNSLQSVISSFVLDLQENFQATISTVCKTADKIGSSDQDKTQERCIICKSNLHTKDIKLSALDATNISKLVSFERSHFEQDLENNPELLNILESDNNSSMFPYIHKYFCYGCSRTYSETSQPKLQLHIQKVTNS